MPPTLEDRVRHILEAIADIDLILAGKSYEEFAADTFLGAAVERFLERVCEATRHIPADVKAAERTIPWQKVADLGNRLRHAYHSIDPAIVWQMQQPTFSRSSNSSNESLKAARANKHT